MSTPQAQAQCPGATNPLGINLTVAQNGSQSQNSQPGWAPRNKLRKSPTFVNVGASPTWLEKQPWRHEGYPLFSRWMASDDDFLVLKKFDTESVRVALWMQDRIAVLSEQLAEIDRYYENQKGDCGRFRIHEYPDERLTIMAKLSKDLKEYHDFVNSFSLMKDKPRASRLQVKNVSTWLENRRGAINPDETKFVTEENTRDLISLARKQSPLRRFINHCWFITELPFLKEGRSTETTTYNKESVIDRSVYCITIILGLGMLLGPLWLLQNDTMPGSQNQLLAIVSAFTGGFACFFAIVAVSQPFEVLAATAAYAAVLMVYLQIQASAQSPS